MSHKGNLLQIQEDFYTLMFVPPPQRNKSSDWSTSALHSQVKLSNHWCSFHIGKYDACVQNEHTFVFYIFDSFKITRGIFKKCSTQHSSCVWLCGNRNFLNALKTFSEEELTLGTWLMVKTRGNLRLSMTAARCCFCCYRLAGELNWGRRQGVPLSL